VRGKAVSAVSATGTVAAPHLCNVVTDRIEQAQRMCTALGPGHTSTAMWVVAVELGDALTLEQEPGDADVSPRYRAGVHRRGMVRDQER
jgi:hypothetical protein